MEKIEVIINIPTSELSVEITSSEEYEVIIL